MEIAFNNLVRDVMAAGKYAAAKQSTVSRSIKKDGTILTKTDTELDKLITEKINEYFPNSVIISEENPLPIQNIKNSDWIFTLDPIDGTDSYSQGMPGWCVAVGILDSGLTPVGAIIFAPRWGTDTEGGNILTLMPGGTIKLNGKDLDTTNLDDTDQAQIMMGSSVHNFFDFSTLANKLRVSGSAVINISAPLLHSAVNGAILTPCYIWDVAPAHAVIQNAGMDLEYYSGGKINYAALIDRSKARDHFVSGSPDTLTLIRKHFKLK
ncbi:MAG: inositol monophosphatase [Spirochaetia bacterium]|jgi:fructose-1,6-bisphosphatase/inositol monophosphatase family enzyme|nr:inositol monophosphatase [Spirochaetia bacterium]